MRTIVDKMYEEFDMTDDMWNLNAVFVASDGASALRQCQAPFSEAIWCAGHKVALAASTMI